MLCRQFFTYFSEFVVLCHFGSGYPPPKSPSKRGGLSKASGFNLQNFYFQSSVIGHPAPSPKTHLLTNSKTHIYFLPLQEWKKPLWKYRFQPCPTVPECISIMIKTVKFSMLADRKSTRLNSSHVKISYAV